MELIYKKLYSIGFAFIESNQDKSPLSLKETHPEKVLIEAIEISDFSTNLELLTLIPVWLEMYSALINVKSLLKEAKKLDSFKVKIFLGCISKTNEFKNKYSNKFYGSLRCKKEKRDKIGLDFQIKRLGLDKDFSKFGIRSPKIELSKRAKFLEQSYVVKKNLWFKNRSVIGVNYRSDIYTLFSNGSILSGYDIAKYLNCSFGQVYPVLNSLKRFN
ncbi:MAG: hypothetical protein GY909_15360 [Oligoflexia bacterium]|nr:hypothetical protein [Oligoflexia bacterium]